MATIEEFKKITETSTMAKIDNLDIDTTTANIVIEVYNGIKPHQQEKMMKQEVAVIVDLCYRMIATKEGG